VLYDRTFKKFKTFDDYLNTLRKQVRVICFSYVAQTTHRIEYGDLYQEAIIRLFELYSSDLPLDVNYSLKAVKHRLVNYIKKNSRDAMLLRDISNLAYGNKSFED
jgi:DNA-directed RNA polymerase specialized sigma24 family protein